MGKRQTEEVAVHLSQDFDTFYGLPLKPFTDPGPEEKILVISADGKGIVMHPEGLREDTRKASERAERKQRTRLSPGEKGHRKRMATVSSVYETERYPRTAAQILDPGKSPKGPCSQRERTMGHEERPWPPASRAVRH